LMVSDGVSVKMMALTIFVHCMLRSRLIEALRTQSSTVASAAVIALCVGCGIPPGRVQCFCNAGIEYRTWCGLAMQIGDEIPLICFFVATELNCEWKCSPYYMV
jgi:hypothetical protein